MVQRNINVIREMSFHLSVHLASYISVCLFVFKAYKQTGFKSFFFQYYLLHWNLNCNCASCLLCYHHSKFSSEWSTTLVATLSPMYAIHAINKTRTRSVSPNTQHLVSVNVSDVVLLCHATTYLLEDLDGNTLIYGRPRRNQPPTLRVQTCLLLVPEPRHLQIYNLHLFLPPLLFFINIHSPVVFVIQLSQCICCLSNKPYSSVSDA